MPETLRDQILNLIWEDVEERVQSVPHLADAFLEPYDEDTLYDNIELCRKHYGWTLAETVHYTFYLLVPVKSLDSTLEEAETWDCESISCVFRLLLAHYRLWR